MNVVLAAALPAIPGAAGLLGLLVGRSRPAAALAVTTAGATLITALALWIRLGTTSEMPRRYADYIAESDVGTRLADFGPLHVVLAVRIDTVAAVVAVMVATVALAVQVYSIAYLKTDDRYAPYAAQVSLFTAAMLLVVVSGDLFLLLVGWEVMGLCSYLLIGHDRSLPEAPAAAVKAFLVTRVGDVGFLLGIVVLGLGAGSFRIADVLTADLGDDTRLAACLLLLAGVAGKSAQFPLHTWLPDAMAGPTPISALIHAATMVAAGVYVVIRLYPLYTATPDALAALGVLAAITMLLAAFAALAQDDVKRVLAWSTVSQLAYMTGGLAVGRDGAALHHLLTHAAFKALLFLAAGAVIHAVASNSMSAMGGLRRRMPITFWTTTIGLAALAGVPPFSGFWTKEGVLGAAEESHTWVGRLVLTAGLLTTALTGAYAARLWLRTFFGDYRGTEEPHDPQALMRWPIVLLAIPAAVGGLIVLWPAGGDVGWFAYAPLDEVVTATPPYSVHPGLAIAAVGLTALGAAAVWWRWRRDTAADPVTALGPARPAFAAAFWLDSVQDALVVRPVVTAARRVRALDARAIGGAVTGTGRGAVRLGTVLGRAHARGLGGYVTTALAGGVLLAVIAVVGSRW
ncbi:NADH-quinone oxidoreductase subunit L [Cryptosporangium phraense]|uniref:NADH-quinone oxidoreductase subunit L n=1 Tax=Cryptosporangium phraense TaxID=2593070 RepID=A0A545AUL3_9ACTN|nr:NADH-quinone oxidoreductase subunit L [Cryptosporangium phraense]TQS45024.1 NADH-quinone oxidoreductase subunit L [Cryptosporangium phraense]